MAYTKEQLDALSGDTNYKQSPVGGVYYDTITLGKDGKYYVNFYSQPKDKRSDPSVIGDTFIATILKIRRKLIQWDDNTKVLESVEYDTDSDAIYTTQGVMSEKEAKALGAKVDVVLYLLTEQGIRKYTVPRNSLFSDTADDTYYGYIQSFDRDSGERSYMFETVFGTKQTAYKDRKGQDATGIQTTFKRGAEHVSLDEVGKEITSLPEILAENDARDKKWLGSNKPTTQTSTPIEYPSEEINPNDVPF